MLPYRIPYITPLKQLRLQLKYVVYSVSTALSVFQNFHKPIVCINSLHPYETHTHPEQRTRHDSLVKTPGRFDLAPELRVLASQACSIWGFPDFGVPSFGGDPIKRTINEKMLGWGNYHFHNSTSSERAR